ncbi:MAG: aminodeoxychorismate synthase component I [Halocynthiibacter sp.]
MHKDAACFDAASEVVSVQNPTDIETGFARIKALQAEGKWIAGFMSYELGYALEEKLAHRMPENRAVPLMMFGAYDAPHPAHLSPVSDVAISDVEYGWDEPAYTQAFDMLHGFIQAGDVYQGNLTFPITGRADTRPEHLFQALSQRQAVPYGALIENTGGPAIVSRSPELFFKTNAAGKIETHPMKGTMPRGMTFDEDTANKAFLTSDEKNLAENVMIVDLLRNDLSRVCVAGSVRVPKLFDVQSFETVHQMVSVVEGQLTEKADFEAIIRALFPCGSITGAPKLRAMEILNDLEPAPRDIYCGAIGWMAPDGASCFNVAIRTLLMDENHVRFNVGGGVVYDSTAPSEYEEALWKARFALGT